MNPTIVRNVAILLLLAALIAFAPGAGVTTAVANSLVNAAILTILVFAAGLFYRRHQHDLWSLGDKYRGLLYGALGLVVVLMAGREWLTASGIGTLVLIAGLAGVAFAIWVLFQRVRSYR